jgi:isoleucyl-tRNA synthetase
MSDYKDSLNLPYTDFPMKASLSTREPECLKKWQDANVYQKMRDLRAGAPIFILHDGPPYANARPHLGTAMNKILKDMVLKTKSLSGFDTPFVPGWDCHGLPIELNVEKKHGKPGVKLSKAEFRQACRDYAKKQVQMQREDFIRLGVLAQWDAPYLSLKSSFEADVVRGLIPMIEQGHLRPGQKPVYWCPLCASALADTEVEYQDKVSPAIDVAFHVVDPQALAVIFGVDQLDRAALPIWTTTPWTLPANEAVALNADLDYVLVGTDQHGPLVLASELVDAVMTRYGEKDASVMGMVKGQCLLGAALHHPFMDRQVKVILGDHVQADAGTGNVHTAPAHGEEDYRIGRQYNLPVDNPVMANSCFREGVPLVASMHVYKANEPIIEALRESGHLLAKANYTHSYPHCWRHKKPVIFRATPQYFIGMESSSLRENALKAVESVDWLPGWGQARMQKMLASRPDWCISRQRCWGTPLPLLIHRETQAIHPEMTSILSVIADVIETEGSEAWFDSSVSRWLGSDAADYEKVNDTLDVWFDSGMTHACVLEKRSGLSVPADLYFEGSDQHRGWFQTSLLTSMAMRNEAPYRQVVTHGYVVDAKGKKMSKSVGNVMLPSEVVDKYGADVLRLWAASAYYQDDINVSNEILKRNADAYRRLRNTARFLLSNLYDFDPQQDALDYDDMLLLDQWVMDQAHHLQEKIYDAFEKYQFHIATHGIHQFCVVVLGNFYLDIIKDRLYTCFPTALARRSCQTAMWHLLEALVRWLMPILSFTLKTCLTLILKQGPLKQIKFSYAI